MTISSSPPSLGLVAEKIRSLPYNRKIAGSIPVHGHFATPLSKVFNLAMLSMVALATAMVALRAAFGVIHQTS